MCVFSFTAHAKKADPAKALFEAMDMQQTMLYSVDAMIDQMAASTPSIKGKEVEFSNVMKEILDWRKSTSVSL